MVNSKLSASGSKVTALALLLSSARGLGAGTSMDDSVSTLLQKSAQPPQALAQTQALEKVASEQRDFGLNQPFMGSPALLAQNQPPYQGQALAEQPQGYYYPPMGQEMVQYNNFQVPTTQVPAEQQPQQPQQAQFVQQPGMFDFSSSEQLPSFNQTGTSGLADLSSSAFNFQMQTSPQANTTTALAVNQTAQSKTASYAQPKNATALASTVVRTTPAQNVTAQQAVQKASTPSNSTLNQEHETAAERIDRLNSKAVVIAKPSETGGSIDLGEDDPVAHPATKNADSKTTEIQSKINSLEEQIAKAEMKNQELNMKIQAKLNSSRTAHPANTSAVALAQTESDAKSKSKYYYQDPNYPGQMFAETTSWGSQLPAQPYFPSSQSLPQQQMPPTFDSAGPMQAGPSSLAMGGPSAATFGSPTGVAQPGSPGSAPIDASALHQPGTKLNQIQGQVAELKTQEAELQGIKSQTKIAKQKAEIAKLKAEKALLKSDLAQKEVSNSTSPDEKSTKEGATHAVVQTEKKEKKEKKSGDESPGSGKRIANILKQLQTEIEARGKAEEEEGEKEEKQEKAKEEKEPKEEEKEEKKGKKKSNAQKGGSSSEGMKAIEEFFSGAEGVKRSKALIKFVKLLEAGGGEDGKAEKSGDKKKLAQSSTKEADEDEEESSKDSEKDQPEEKKDSKKKEPKKEPSKKAKSAAQRSTSGRITLSHKKKTGSLSSRVKKAARIEEEDEPGQEQQHPRHKQKKSKNLAEFSL